jgi:hypothetical protein
MFAEIGLYLKADAPASVRRVGLVSESVALWSRGRRRRAQWAAHEKRCHDVVRRAMQGLPARRTLLVLGSGLLRDIPFDELAAAFARVVLLDAVHLAPVRRRIATSPHVATVARDVTGALDWVTGASAARADALADFLADPAIDLVISANVLSQLPLAPEKWLERHGARAAALPADIAGRMIGWHLDDLGRFRCRVCLLTDVAMDERGRDGAVIDSLDLMRGAVLPPPDDEWSWTVSPFGEESRGREYVHRVRGYVDFAAAGERTERAA